MEKEHDSHYIKFFIYPDESISKISRVLQLHSHKIIVLDRAGDEFTGHSGVYIRSLEYTANDQKKK